MARAADAPREFSGDDLISQAREYVSAKKNIDMYEERTKELKTSLFSHIENDGFEDDKGNVWLELPEPVDEFLSVQKQKRTVQKIDKASETAIDAIKAKGLGDRLLKMVENVDEDELMAAVYDGTLTEEEVEAMFPTKVTWALVLSKK
jgi:hypothetical protein